MDGDFQQQYQDAERAYGEGDYTAAHRLASGLLGQLMDQPEDPEAQAAVLGWRAFVALLLGHIELYGRDNPNQAAGYYEQVLASQPHETLAELAEQGLERSRQSRSATSQPDESLTEADEPPLEEPPQQSTARQPLPEMLRDPFLTDQPAGSKATANSLELEGNGNSRTNSNALARAEQLKPTPDPFSRSSGTHGGFKVLNQVQNPLLSSRPNQLRFPSSKRSCCRKQLQSRPRHQTLHRGGSPGGPRWQSAAGQDQPAVYDSGGGPTRTSPAVMDPAAAGPGGAPLIRRPPNGGGGCGQPASPVQAQASMPLAG